MPYRSNTLPIRKLSLKKPLVFQSKRTGSAITLSSIQMMLHFLQDVRCSFTSTTLLVHTATLKSLLKIRSDT